MKKIITGLIAAIAVTSALAVDFTWVEIAHSDDGANRFSVAREKTSISKNNDNEQIVVTLGKSVMGDKINTFQWYVRISDCRRGYGNVVFTNLNGDWLANGEFANGNETMITAVANGLCDWALNVALKPAKPAKPIKPAA